MTGFDRSCDAEGKRYGNIKRVHLLYVYSRSKSTPLLRDTPGNDDTDVLNQYAVDMDRELYCELFQFNSTGTFYVDEMADKTPALDTHSAPTISNKSILRHVRSSASIVEFERAVLADEQAAQHAADGDAVRALHGEHQAQDIAEHVTRHVLHPAAAADQWCA